MNADTQYTNTRSKIDSPYLHKAFDATVWVVEKVSLVGVAVFAAYTWPELFLGSYGVGLVLGFVAYWIIPPRKCDHHEHADAGCSQGELERLTGIRMPEPLGLILGVAVLICHMEHHALVFVPIAGLYFGAYIGHQSAHITRSITK